MPLRSRHGYAADLHHGLPTGDITQPRSSPHDLRAGAHRSPAQIRQVRAGGLLLRGVQPLVPHVHLPVLLAGPAPSGGAGTSRRCQGCFHPSRPSRRVRLPSASTSPLRRAGGGAFHHRTVQQRLVALDIGDPQPVRLWRQEVPFDEPGADGCASATTGNSERFFAFAMLAGDRLCDNRLPCAATARLP